MSNAEPIRETVYEDQAALFRCRFVDNTGTPYKQAGITSIKYDAFQLVPYSATALANDTALVVATTITDNLAAWDVDATGYNFSTTFPYTLFATPGLVLIEVYATPSAGGATQVLAARVEVTVLGKVGG